MPRSLIMKILQETRGGGYRLDADTKFHVLHFVARMRIKVVRSPPIELVPLPQFASHKQPQSHRTESRRNPPDRPQHRRLFHLGKRLSDRINGAGRQNLWSFLDIVAGETV